MSLFGDMTSFTVMFVKSMKLQKTLRDILFFGLMCFASYPSPYNDIHRHKNANETGSYRHMVYYMLEQRGSCYLRMTMLLFGYLMSSVMVLFRESMAFMISYTKPSLTIISDVRRRHNNTVDPPSNDIRCGEVYHVTISATTVYETVDDIFTIHSFNHQIRSDRRQSDFHTSHMYTNNRYLCDSHEVQYYIVEVHPQNHKFHRGSNTKQLYHHIEAIERRIRLIHDMIGHILLYAALSTVLL
eukprot:923122_1